MPDTREGLVQLIEYQAYSCRELGSPLYGALLDAAAADAAAGGPVYRVLEDKAGDPDGSALVLRLMAAVHRLVLRGEAPELAAFYPSAGGSAAGAGAARVFLEVVEAQEAWLREDSRRPLQTNEVGRCAALVGGFLTLAERSGLPLDAVEVGASAGFNLRWDHYLYEARGETWGDPASPVRLCGYNTDAPPPFGVEAEVVRRRGCDPSPIDPSSDEGRVSLLSFVWPDQAARIRLLKAAMEVARRVPVTVEPSPASAWLPAALSDRPDAAATVVYHSIVWQYMDEDEQGAVTAAIEGAGGRATRDAPLAWLRMEPSEDQKIVEVRLRTWPGDEDNLIATSGYHGTSVRWLGGRP
ncbi:MAG TPA: DUF2332 domain-containing protein [Actinomycetota bacterium]|nr:DUF2332 domain-containing protein [Actinomycetota bacterium]